MSHANWTDLIELEDPATEAERLIEMIRAGVRGYRRGGAVVGVSGGIDSAVTLALTARAVGAERTVAVMLPDRDSDPASARLGREVAERVGAEPVVLDITPQLTAWGAYDMCDDATREVFPDFDVQLDRMRVEFKPRLDSGDAFPLFCLTRVRPDGTAETRYLRPRPYLEIVAATNLKQRTRMTALYHAAERRNFIVVGTANLLEVEQGFFVRHGDGAGDIFPLAGLYKTQVYRLAAILDIPGEIVERPPTTDTYSADQTQEEFFYGLPVRETDLTWAGFRSGATADQISAELGMEEPVVHKLLQGFERRIAIASYLRAAPLAPQPVAAS
jgi:NAD+ synthase